MTESLSPPAAPNIARQPDPIGRARREKVAGHRGLTLWMTGLSGAGKTTLARAVATALYEIGARVYVLDAENVRHGLCRDLGFSPADRREHVRRLAEVARLFVDAGTVTIVACISPYVADRDLARAIVGDDDFSEVFVATPLDVCEARDPRGLYARARSGEIPSFTGVSAPYESPQYPELLIPAGSESVDASVARVLALLETHGIGP